MKMEGAIVNLFSTRWEMCLAFSSVSGSSNGKNLKGRGADIEGVVGGRYGWH